MSICVFHVGLSKIKVNDALDSQVPDALKDLFDKLGLFMKEVHWFGQVNSCTNPDG